MGMIGRLEHPMDEEVFLSFAEGPLSQLAVIRHYARCWERR